VAPRLNVAGTVNVAGVTVPFGWKVRLMLVFGGCMVISCSPLSVWLTPHGSEGLGWSA
jgi:hypothetical protein